MTLTRIYFTGSTLIGLLHFSYLFNMINHTGADSLSYIIGALCLIWIPVCLIAIICMLKKPLYCLSPVLYITYCIANYFTAPEFSFEADFDFTGILCIVFGLGYASYNSLLWHRETSTQNLANN